MKFSPKSKTATVVLAGIALFGMGVFFGKHLSIQFPVPIMGIQASTSAFRQGGGKYTNPLLECDQSQGEFMELKPFKGIINDNVTALEQDPDTSLISVYFRDMNNGPWFGINSTATFSPASLLKLPLAIAYYKLNELTPGYIKKSISFKGPDSSWPDISQTISPKISLVAGQTYTLEELIKRMLAYSDNQAYYLLFSNINPRDLQTVYNDFNLKLADDSPADDSTVTVQGYSSFFRILFNASYLNQEDSEKVLSLLAGSDFKQGLAAGVPANIPVANKFGERELTGSSLDQIHDCGIVYYPQHPYLLCIMTQGQNTNKQIDAIKQLSASVYQEVDGQSAQN
jgi:beta-lactamase class A